MTSFQAIKTSMTPISRAYFRRLIVPWGPVAGCVWEGEHSFEKEPVPAFLVSA